MQYDSDDVDNLALVAWKEARGDGDTAMQAVMHVIVNRVLSVGFPKTVHEAIYQQNAFSSMSISTDPEYNLQPLNGDKQFEFCQNLAPDVLSGADMDNTKHAIYYANEAHITSGWYKRVIMDSGRFPVTVIIGKQTFRS